MAQRPVVVLGGPGDGLVVAAGVRAAAQQGGSLSLFGFLNDALPVDTDLLGAPVLGPLEDWHRLPDDVLFLAALHKVKVMAERASRIEGLGIPDDRWATVIHPAAWIAEDISIGFGTFIGPHVVIQPGASVGRHASMRGGANVGHDANVGDFAYLGPNSTLCGRATLKRGAHLGPNSVVVDSVAVGEYAVVGVASAVTKNVPDGTVYFGVPAQKVGQVVLPEA